MVSRDDCYCGGCLFLLSRSLCHDRILLLLLSWSCFSQSHLHASMLLLMQSPLLALLLLVMLLQSRMLTSLSLVVVLVSFSPHNVAFLVAIWRSIALCMSGK